MAEWIEFVCPNGDCRHPHLVREFAATRQDPAYLEMDPPDECEVCETPMEGVESERADPADYEPDAYDHHYDR